MLRLTWDPKNPREVHLAQAAFDVHVSAGFVPQHKGQTIKRFDGKLGTITFEPRKTCFARLMSAIWED